MKPTWDKLMQMYEGSDTAVVADVDCTAAGQALCEAHGVQGFPTLKWGDPELLVDYEGGREFDDLVAWSEANLKPTCSPWHTALCDEGARAQIEKLMKLNSEDLDIEINAHTAHLAQIETFFDTEVNKLGDEYQRLDEKRRVSNSEDAEHVFDADVKGLQEAYSRLEQEKAANETLVKTSGKTPLTLMKAVKAHRKVASQSTEL